MRPGFVGRTLDGLGLLFGRLPAKPAPEEITEAARAMHERIPGARLHVFARCGHLPPMEVPQETTAVLRDWLQAS